MKNIELLQATGIRDIRIVSYQLKDDARMREAFPDTTLYVVSNGLLIPRVKKKSSTPSGRAMPSCIFPMIPRPSK